MKAVVKVSGNLIWHINILDTLLNTILKLQNSNIRVALVPGGSIFADIVRDLQKRVGFDDSAAHWMAIKSMEVYGAFIASRNSCIESVDSIEGVYTIWSIGRLPLIMPFNIIKQNNVLPYTWSVTSDAITVFIAYLLKADIAILTKLVDGITINGVIVPTIKVDEVPSNQDVIDSYTPVLIKKYGIPTLIINAHNAEVLNCLLEKAGRCTSHTAIAPHTLITP